MGITEFLNLNIGLLYTVLVSGTLLLVSFVVSLSISNRKKYFDDQDQAYMKYLSHFWGMMGLMWFFVILGSYFSWNNNQALEKLIYYATLTTFAFQTIYLFLYFKRRLFSCSGCL